MLWLLRYGLILPHICGTAVQKSQRTTVGFRMFSSSKKFVFIRHGKTEMNEKLEITPWYSNNFKDHALWDSKLSSAGVEQAIVCHQKIFSGQNSSDIAKVQLLVSSPLSRAIHTADLIFHNSLSIIADDVPRIIHPLLRERMYLSSEVGKLRNELQTNFNRWDFTLLPEDDPWWYIAPFATESEATKFARDHCDIYLSQKRACPSSVQSNINFYNTSCDTHGCISKDDYELVAEYEEALRSPYEEWRPHGKYCGPGEPARVFAARMRLLRRWLLRRPEQYIAVVAHWGVFKALTGEEFPNAEARIFTEDQLLEVPDVTDD